MEKTVNTTYSEIVIITGGTLEEAFTCDFLCSKSNPYIIGVDKGVEFLLKHNIYAHEIMGDFDSVDENKLNLYLYSEKCGVKSKFNPEKDDTDTQLAIKKATTLSEEFGKIDVYILGATGTRLDHVFANVHGLTYGFDRGINIFIINSTNKMYICPKEYRIGKQNQFGVYFSLIPISEEVTSITLNGFKYPLSNYNLTVKNSLAVSNEIIDDIAEVRYETGYLLAIESRDWFMVNY